VLSALLRSTHKLQSYLRGMIGMQSNAVGTDKGVTPNDHVRGSNTGKTTMHKLRLQFANVNTHVSQFFSKRSKDFIQLLGSILGFPSRVYMYFSSIYKSLLDDTVVMSFPEKPSDHFQIRRILHAIAMIPRLAKSRLPAPVTLTPTKVFPAAIVTLLLAAQCYCAGLIVLGNLLIVVQLGILIDQLLHRLYFDFSHFNFCLQNGKISLQYAGPLWQFITVKLDTILFKLRMTAIIAFCYSFGLIVYGNLLLVMQLRNLIENLPISMRHGAVLRLFISVLLAITAFMTPALLPSTMLGLSNILLSNLPTVLIWTSLWTALLPASIIMRSSWYKECPDNKHAYISKFFELIDHIRRDEMFSWYRREMVVPLLRMLYTITNYTAYAYWPTQYAPTSFKSHIIKNYTAYAYSKTKDETIFFKSHINTPVTTPNETPINRPVSSTQCSVIGSQPIQKYLPNVTLNAKTFNMIQFRDRNARFRDVIQFVYDRKINNFLNDFMYARDYHSQINHVHRGTCLVERMLSGDGDEVISLSTLGRNIKTYQGPIFDDFYRTLQQFFVCFLIRDMHRLLEKPDVHQFSPVFEAVTDIFSKIRLGFNPLSFHYAFAYELVQRKIVQMMNPEQSFHMINHFLLINLLDLMIMNMSLDNKEDVMYRSTYEELTSAITDFKESKCQNNLTPQFKMIMDYLDYSDSYTASQTKGNQPSM
jgi:hypothetical protein